MSAPQIEAPLPDALGSLASTMTPQPHRSGLILPGHLEPAEPEVDEVAGTDPALASVTALPSLEDTAPLEPVAEPEFGAVPQPPPTVAVLPVDRPEPVTIQPVSRRAVEDRPDFAAARRPVVVAAPPAERLEPYTIRLVPPPESARPDFAAAPRPARSVPAWRPTSTVIRLDRSTQPAPVSQGSGLRRLLHAWAARVESQPRRKTKAKTKTVDHTVPGWSLGPLGAAMGIAAVAAFVLSFQMILPVVLAAGWTPRVAWLGPIVIDVAACAAAFMSVASRHPVFTRTGRFLLVTATALSITLNLAGHEINQGTHRGLVVPVQWEWTVQLFSVAVPVILAVLIHAFGKALITWTHQRPAKPASASAGTSTSAASASASSPSAPSGSTTTASTQPRTSTKKAKSQPRSATFADAQRVFAASTSAITQPSQLAEAMERDGLLRPHRNTASGWLRQLHA